MRIINNKLKLLIIVLILFSCTFLVKIKDSFGIYKSTLSTTINLSVLDPSTNFVVTLEKNDGSGDTTTVQKTYNEQMGSDLYTPTRTNYNFMGWYDSNNNRIYPTQHITGNVTYHAVWAEIVCKKATALNTETCLGTAGCVTDSIYSKNNTITYGSLYGQSSIFGLTSPKVGDAYDCNVYYDNNYDETDINGKHVERFYYVREKENSGSENTVVLVYYTVFDGTGRVDTQNTDKDDIDSQHYSTAIGWLPTASNSIASAKWDNPGLIDFDGNKGKISRFLSRTDFESICEPFTLGSNNTTSVDSAYLEACFGGSQDNNKNWFLFENSRFQSNTRGRAGIWLETDGTNYYRLQTSALSAHHFSDGNSSNNIAKPVIEVPISALEGYENTTRYTVDFNSHDGSAVNEIRRIYEGEEIGTLPTTTRDHYTFDGWYATYDNGVYSNPVTATTVVLGNMTLHAKWTAKQTCTVTLELNGGTGLTSPVIVDYDDTYDPGTPEKADNSFVGWYTDSTLDTPYDSTVPISSPTLTLYAKWTSANYVAQVNNVKYDTLAGAIAAVPTGKVKTTITILKDITLSEAVEIPNTKYVELDGGSYTISGTNSLISNKGYLDIISGTISLSNSSAVVNVIANTSGARLNISGGTISASNTSEKTYLIDNPSGATVNITGGTVANNCYVAGATTEFLAINNNGTTTISGGSITSYGQSATINQNGGTLNVSGGEIIAHNTTKGQAIYIAGGTTNISGDANIENTSLSSGSNARAAVDNNGGTLVITGGTIVSNQYVAVIGKKSGATTRIGTDDGYINTTTPVLRGKVYGLERSNGTVSVYDGIFECLDNTTAVNGTITRPNGINFTDSTIDVSGVTYVSTYLLAPSVTVTFDANGGTVEGVSTYDVTVDNGNSVGGDMPADAIRANYYFDGWYDSNNAAFTSSTPVTMTKTVYAKWVQDFTNGTVPSSLSVEMSDTENIVITGTDLEDVTYTSNDTSIATVDSDGTVHGVNVGSTTITITGTKSGSTSTVTINVTPIMRTVRFYDSDGETLLETKTVANNSSLGVNMYSATKNNYVFDKWTIKNTITVFTSETTVTGDVDVVANWKETITYATVSTSPSPFTIVVGNTGQITLSATSQGDTIEPYTYTTDNGSVATVNANGEVTAVGAGTTDIIITGTSSSETRTVEVTVTNPTNTVYFYNGTTLYDSKTVSVGGSVDANMPNDPTKQNCIFAGWYIDDNALTPFTSSTAVNNPINVYAKWKETLTIATLPTSPMIIMIGDNEEVLVTPTSEDFVEDYTLSSSNTNYVEVSDKRIYGMALGTVTLTITGAESNVSRTITVEVVNSYTVTFDPDNGDSVTTIHVETGTSIDASGENLPPNPTKSGYTFDDWYLYDETKEEVTTTRLDTSANVTSALVYKPRWAGANDVAAIGTTYYTTPKAAIDAVSGSTETEVRLLKDYAIGAVRTTVSGGKNIVFNANGHELSCGNSTTGNLLYVDGGTLRVKNGTFTCNKSGLATLETSSKSNPKSYLYIEPGTIVENTNNRGAIYNSGTVYILGGTITSSTSVRSTITNGAAGARVEMSGGTVSQTATSYTADNKNNGKGAIKVAAGTVIITGGTVTSSSTNSAAIDKQGGGTLIIGTDDNDNSYDATNPIIQGEQYGIEATSDYSVYDGIIKGKTAAVNDETKITGYETGTTKQNGTDGDYYTLYYAVPAPVQKYRINFTVNGGSGAPAYQEYDLNVAITPSDLPTPTRGIYTFDGWFDSNDTAFTTFTPTAAGETTLYASWSYASSSIPVDHVITGDAMTYYFNNVNTWTAADALIAANQDTNLNNDDHTTYASTMYANFNNYSCSECEWPNGVQANQNKCESPSSGTYCDKPKGYDTGTNDDIVVYTYVNGAKDTQVSGSGSGKYITVNNGVIYNMIPGETYLWELSSDSSVYGVVSATKNGTHYRRTLNTSVRNLRDIGGMPVSYTVNGVTTTGTIKYGRLYRGAQIASGQTGVNELKKLGITREVDLRANGDGNGGQTKFEAANYDVSLSDNSYLACRHVSDPDAPCLANPNTYNTDGYYDVKITNYQVNPVANDYFSNAYSDNFDDLKAAMKAVMRQIVNHENVFFHCTIGTDRTGTIAYFLEGLLGASEEDRLRDYEMTYFFGLTNRSRFHNNLSTSSINPRFYAMYKSYPTVSDIEAFYKTRPESDDDSLLAAFRQEMILQS